MKTTHPAEKILFSLFGLIAFLVFLFTLLALSGCATQPPPPATFDRVINPPRGMLAGRPYYDNSDPLNSMP